MKRIRGRGLGTDYSGISGTTQGADGVGGTVSGDGSSSSDEAEGGTWLHGLLNPTPKPKPSSGGGISGTTQGADGVGAGTNAADDHYYSGSDTSGELIGGSTKNPDYGDCAGSDCIESDLSADKASTIGGSIIQGAAAEDASIDGGGSSTTGGGGKKPGGGGATPPIGPGKGTTTDATDSGSGSLLLWGGVGIAVAFAGVLLVMSSKKKKGEGSR